MTTSKRQSYNKTRRVGSEPNLGQKAAEREKKSKAQLSHMEGRRPSSARGRFVAWCKQEQASIQQQLELMQSGKVLTGENRGSGWIDTTGESLVCKGVTSPPQLSPFERRALQPAIAPDQRVASCTSWRTSRASSFMVVMEERNF